MKYSLKNTLFFGLIAVLVAAVLVFVMELGGKQCRTNFPLAFLHAMQHYQDSYEKTLEALNDASSALVSSLKKETVS